MAFVLVTMFGMYPGRRLGWLFSKLVLYTAPTAIAILGCMIWGCSVALLIHALIAWQHPHWVLKSIFGFALGAYVAIPNYGLLIESSIPAHATKRHELISALPLCVFIFASIAFACLL